MAESLLIINSSLPGEEEEEELIEDEDEEIEAAKEEEDKEEKEEGDDDDDDDNDNDNDGGIPVDDLLNWIKLALGCFDDASARLRILLDTIEVHTMLESVTITDNVKQGKMVVAGDRISELRDVARAMKSNPRVENGRVELLLKYGFIPSVHLPKSGYFMGRATLVSIKQLTPGGNNNNDDDVADDDILAGLFDGDERGIFREAVTEILAKHKDKLNTSQVAEVVNVGAPTPNQ